ncbi:MAG: serine/threonine protein kinase, partial [Acidobacteria bacterium]|nr:serine/threonine protein kinase [Acidobacteriota bacterium]
MITRMTLDTGVRIGPYEILSPLDVAGIGEVYRARDHEHTRDVAIRVLRVDLAVDPALLRQFEDDVRAAAVLTHPAILDIYDVGTDPHAAYVVSAPYEGETLRALLDRGALSLRGAMRCAVRVVCALAVARRKGIVHRDLRPENVLVTPEGRVTILGFGLTALTQADPSSDLFALAVLCRTLLTAVSYRRLLQRPRRRVAWTAIGLLAIAAGILLPVTRDAADEPTTLAAPPQATASETVPPEPETRAGQDSFEAIARSDEPSLTVPEVVAVAGASRRTEASSQGKGVPPDRDAVRGPVAGIDANQGLPSAVVE